MTTASPIKTVTGLCVCHAAYATILRGSDRDRPGVFTGNIIPVPSLAGYEPDDPAEYHVMPVSSIIAAGRFDGTTQTYGASV